MVLLVCLSGNWCWLLLWILIVSFCVIVVLVSVSNVVLGVGVLENVIDVDFGG